MNCHLHWPNSKTYVSTFALLTPKTGKPNTQTFQKPRCIKHLWSNCRVYSYAWVRPGHFLGKIDPQKLMQLIGPKQFRNISTRHVKRHIFSVFLLVGSSILIIVENDCKWSSTWDTGTQTTTCWWNTYKLLLLWQRVIQLLKPRPSCNKQL